MKTAVFALCLFICSTVFYFSSSAQQSAIRSCRRITACTTSTGTNNAGQSMCSVKYSYEGCDGTIPGGAGACVNNGCAVQDCECSCTGSAPNFDSYGFSWSDCEEVIHISTKVCDRCVNPTPTPTPRPCPTPTGPPPDGRRDCLWFKSICRWECGLIAVNEDQCEAEGWAWDFASNTCQTPSPTPYPGTPTPATPTPTPTSGGHGCSPWIAAWCEDYDFDTCTCYGGINKSPVIIDVRGDGFALTDAGGGVNFDLDGNGVAERIAWTAPGADEAFLALDHDGDGLISVGTELFGNFTRQPPSDQPNGFLALAEFDKPAGGGNSDGVIDARDAVFASLRLWQDANHDGVSQPAELHALPALDIVRLHLAYKESKREDAHGNQFRYRAKVDDAKGAKANRWAWDVFFKAAP